MLSARLHGTGDVRLHDEPIPEPGPGEVLLRVTAVGLCGSDVHWYNEGAIGDARLTRPLVLGHEFAGEIEGGDEHGRRVAVDPAVPCNGCEFCHGGHPNLCTDLRFAGHAEQDGALREYIAWPASALHPIPDSLSEADGMMLEGLGVAIHAVDLAHLRLAETVGVYGCGPIGLLILQLARASGATRVIATEKLSHRIEAARALGADQVFLADGSEAERILAATGGRGVDVAFEAAGENDAVEAAVASARRGARIILVGIPPDDRTSFAASVARRKGLTFKVSRRMKHVYPRAIRLVESGLVDVRSLVTHTFPLAEVGEAFDLARKRAGIKVMIAPT